MKKKSAHMVKQLTDAFQIPTHLNKRHQEKDNNPSQSRRTVEDLLEIKRYKEMHDDFYEL